MLVFENRQRCFDRFWPDGSGLKNLLKSTQYQLTTAFFARITECTTPTWNSHFYLRTGSSAYWPGARQGKGACLQS